MDILKYKEYEGTAEIDLDRMVCRGKILFIDDLVTYEAGTPQELRKEFEAAVDDYIETCALLKREPQKPLKGLFNVRIAPELHRALSLRALKDDVSQNEVVSRAIDAYVCTHSGVSLTVNIPESALRVITTGSSAPAQQHWETVRVVH